MNVNGKQQPIVLRYDKECSRPEVITPMYNGMTFLAGYCEPLSKLVIDGIEVSADANGFFYCVFDAENYPNGFEGENIVIECTDIPGNNQVFGGDKDPVKYAVADDFWDDELDEVRVAAVYTDGMCLVDPDEFIVGVATYVDMSQLKADGELSFDILAAHIFKVGEVTLYYDEAEGISFDIEFTADYGMETGADAELRFFAEQPKAADMSSNANDISIENIDLNAEGFWFILNAEYEFDSDMLELADGVELVY